MPTSIDIPRLLRQIPSQYPFVLVDRVLDYAFELAARRPAKHLTSATKSNGISISMPY